MNPKNSFAPAMEKKQQEMTFSSQINSPAMKAMIAKALGSPAAAARLTATLISAVASNAQLQQCEASTVVAAALRGEGMSLIYGHGYYVVPYGTVATYITGYKGYIQLAMSTGLYADIDCIEIRDGELEGRDRRTGKPIINLAKYETDEERGTHPIVGYYGYFELKDGTFRYEYWPMDKLLRHGDRYSKAFSLEKFLEMQSGKMGPKDVEKLLNGSPWYDPNGGQDKMCRKTVLRQLLNSGYAPLSPEVRSFIESDGQSEDEGIIPDFTTSPKVVPSTGEVIDDAPASENIAPVGAEAPVSAPEAKDKNVPTQVKNAPESTSGASEADQDYSEGFFGMK